VKFEAIAYVIAGACFGIILGWVIATQQVNRAAAAPPSTSATQPAPSGQSSGGQRQPPALDEARVQQLTTIVTSDPKNVNAAVQLGNTYMDAERYPDAIKWYQQALSIEPNNPDVSTDLGISFYYSNRTDEALKQFEHSLQIDPNHVKTLLNKGVVLAFGKQDLQGAETAWRRIVELAPDSPEGQAAKRGLEGIAAAHQGAAATPASK
jgi:tetratricopeptide (TPR) repeat protein